jgi:DNA-binding MarR family transcriptional regulator
MSRYTRKGVIETLGATVRAYHRAVDAVDEAAAEYLGVNRTDIRCLDVLLEQRESTPGRLAEAVGLTTGSVTAMLDRLERLGYVERTPHPTDRRRFDVRPTQRTIDAAIALYGPLVEGAQRILGRYSIDELELLIDFLRRDRAHQEVNAERMRAMRGARAQQRGRPK